MLTKFLDKGIPTHTCLEPFETISINLSGAVYICGCPGWLPTSVGNLNNTSLIEMLRTNLVKDIRNSVLDGSFVFCNEKTCGLINNNNLLPKNTLGDDQKKLIDETVKGKIIYPKKIFISGDLTCNLSCPSCRIGVIKLNETQIVEQKKLIKNITQNLFSRPSDDNITIFISTSGEIFASPVLLTFLENINIDYFPNLRLHLQTNGLLMKQNWKKLKNLENKVDVVNVTIDSHLPEIYSKLRRGGNFEKLVENLHWLKEKKIKDNIFLIIKMVVQKENFQTMIDFYNWCLQFNPDELHFARITDWRTYSKEDFFDIDVFNNNHSDYKTAVEVLDKLKKLSKTRVMGGL